MTNLPDSLVRFYEDGPDWPHTPQRQKAERAYRDAFLKSVPLSGPSALKTRETSDVSW